ncbi:MAG: enoyl-CoA hydratase/isomerase family protein [Actinobacteria bacterium]|nr:enoyl-CoA hydratase/isomerase family protein [Actinomycetota bacterium]NBP53123.1 enoyl-CoA hydratase/isomerase family protein [Actinomycetota bacterium]
MGDFTRVGAVVDHVGRIVLNQPPNNFFSVGMIGEIADALESFDADDDCRAVVLSAEGKHFCAGADFSRRDARDDTGELYRMAVRLFRTRKPIVAAVQGAAIGGGLGVALAADFRFVSPSGRLSANFAQLGFHHGFGLSVTLPRLVGNQRAADLLFTGRRVDGAEAVALGLADRLVDDSGLVEAAVAYAVAIASAAPLAVESIRATLRRDLADRVAVATEHELAEQLRLRKTNDFAEGVRATAERRTARFTRS